jgi:nucleoside-diphosphate-sugar epimerase
LCRRLVDAGATVNAISTQNNFVGQPAGVAWSAVELADPGAVKRMLEQFAPDVVFHLSGHVTGSQTLADVQPTFSRNLVSTVHLLTATAERARCRIVLAGSMQEPEGEDPDATPVSPYAASKWACTIYARMFHRLYELPVIVARPMMVYGPGQWDRTKLLPYVITSLLNGFSPAVSSGTRTLDWVFVDDVVAGMMELAMTPSAYGQAIDLGSGALTSIREIVEQVAGILGWMNPIAFGTVPDRPFERPRKARVHETLQVIGWAAATPLSTGLVKTVDYWRAALRNAEQSIITGPEIPLRVE